MIKIIELSLQGFWHFVGVILLISIILNCITLSIKIIMRHWNIRKHGYPPFHCDADGDFKKESNK